MKKQTALQRAIEKYKALHFDKTGENLSDKEATEQAVNLLEYYKKLLSCATILSK